MVVFVFEALGACRRMAWFTPFWVMAQHPLSIPLNPLVTVTRRSIGLGTG